MIDEDIKQRVKVCGIFLLQVYKVTMGTMLSLFLPQNCEDRMCSIHDNYMNNEVYHRTTFYWNCFSGLLFICCYLIELYREEWCVKYLDIDNNIPDNSLKHIIVQEKELDTKMDKLNITPSKVSKYGINIAKDGVSRSASQVLGQKDVNMSKIREIWPEIKYVSREIDEQLEISSHYKGYLKKQNADILAFKRDENLIIPKNINYEDFPGLSNEVKSKFKKIQPKTMGQALRIDGITPAAVYILLSHLKRKSIKHIA